jgi:filamentous hemagglutinin
VPKAWSKRARINAAELPRDGKIRYVPPKDWSPSSPLPRGPNKGYIDRFGNEWVKGPSRTSGEAFEWDVQLTKNASQSIKKLSPDTKSNKHLNVSLEGKITH